MKQKAVVKSRSLFSKALKIVLLLLFIGALLTVSRGVFRLVNSGDRVKSAQERLAAVKLEQEEIRAKLSDVTSDFYREKQARDQLGLARVGEVVVVLPDEDLLRRLSPRISEGADLEPPEPNWKKWARLFFDI